MKTSGLTQGLRLSGILLLSVAFMCAFRLGSLDLYGSSGRKCVPLVYEDVVRLECLHTVTVSGDTFCSLYLRLDEDFNGFMTLNKMAGKLWDHKAVAVSADATLCLTPMLDRERRVCEFVSKYPLMKGDDFQIRIPEGLLKINPDFVDVDEMDIPEDDLSSLSVAGAWRRAGVQWSGKGMFSVIDDDSLDGQIPDSKPVDYTYGYYSLLFPLLESLGLKGNLAAEGKRIGIVNDPPLLNDNGLTLKRLQDEKGWSILCHSMECLGDNADNWLVDSLNSSLARRIFEEGPNHGCHPRTVSVYDLQTRRQYWPDLTDSCWIPTPQRYIKPYVYDYRTKECLFYNKDHHIDWHWGEWKRRAERFGIHPVGFVTHNSTSSHSLVPEIMKVFPYGLSDIGAVNINYPPMLSSGVRSGLEGQSLGAYDGNSKDNSFNSKHYRAYCAQIDEAVKKGGWIIFNLHTYRDCWKNSRPGSLISEGDTYPDEWVIPMKGMDSVRDSLTPPPHLGISDWSEWYPCPGTRLEMMWKVLKYAKEKGLVPVTCAEGFSIMGNKGASGYYNRGYRFGMDQLGLIDTEDMYPHYVVSATGETSYFNPLVSDEYNISLDEMECVESAYAGKGRFLVSQGWVAWSCPDPTGISLRVHDPTGRIVAESSSNSLFLDRSLGPLLIVCSVRSGTVIGTVKVAP